MLLAATIAIWVSFFVVAAAAVALRPEPTATRPGGPPYALAAAAVFVPTDLLLVSTLVDRIRLAPLAMVVVVFVLLLLLDSADAAIEVEEVGCVGCNRFSLLTGVTEMEAAAAAAVKAVFCCCCC